MSEHRHCVRTGIAFALLLSSVAALSVEAAQFPSAQQQKKIDADVRAVLRRWEVPGALIAVARDGRVVYICTRTAFEIENRDYASSWTPRSRSVPSPNNSPPPPFCNFRKPARSTSIQPLPPIFRTPRTPEKLRYANS